MTDARFSRRSFFYGPLLAGAVPSGGFGSVASLKALGYKTYNEKLNIACIGVGGRGADDLIALACMQRGKGVYLEKPLTRTPWESRLLTTAAGKYKVATQMGNQAYSLDSDSGASSNGTAPSGASPTTTRPTTISNRCAARAGS